MAAYRPGAGVRLEPVLPRHCPWASGDDLCAISEHHRRARRTGPGHALTVACCRTHGRCFTIYPPGFGPYQRRPVVQVTPDGTGSDGEVADSLFEAAQDAAAGQAWRPSGPAFSTGRWRTQQRHIQLAVRMLGLDPKAPAAVREEIAHRLAVPLLDLAPAPAQCGGYRMRGQRVMEVFARFPRTTELPRLLLACGAVAGLWSTPVFV